MEHCINYSKDFNSKVKWLVIENTEFSEAIKEFKEIGDKK